MGQSDSGYTSCFDEGTFQVDSALKESVLQHKVRNCIGSFIIESGRSVSGGIIAIVSEIEVKELKRRTLSHSCGETPNTDARDVTSVSKRATEVQSKFL
mmetsp:Transcript_42798/g.103122  ORF Transcript_42798/g.103122 Transcript_42798/m.103122 type:complete len:99 (+) Transcript_42798:3-299(+)